MAENPAIYLPTDPAARIVTIRGQKVILDSDLAAIYGVPTKVLNQAVKRNLDRFVMGHSRGGAPCPKAHGTR